MSKKDKNRKYALIGLFIAGILPIVLYQITRFFSNDTVHVPAYYHPESVDTILDEKGKKVLDTMYHTVDNFQLTNQLGKEFDFYRDTKGNVVVAYVFSCACTNPCEQVSHQAEQVQFAYRKRDSLVRILAITENPEQDQVKEIRDYSQKMGANHDIWFFLRGAKDSTDWIINKELFMDNLDSTNAENHLKYMVLIDFNKHIRGYYNAMDSLEIIRLLDDIALLPMEKNPKP